MAYDEITEQYSNPPKDGLKRFWISWWTFSDDPEESLPFMCWLTGSQMTTKLRAAMREEGLARGYPEYGKYEQFLETHGDDDLFEEFYVAKSSLCAWIDAESEEAAYALAFRYYPDSEQRFCEERPDGGLKKMSDRFSH